MPFGDIFGQAQALKLLARTLSQGRVAHAYLFTGPEGVGKRKTALTWAEALNCLAGGADGCGKCNNCRRIQAGTFPDVKEIEPEGSSIKIAQIRSIFKEIYFRPLEGRYKVYIIAAADKMTEEAANSFLKLLEEPPAYAVFVLITSQINLLLPTVISRCQIVPFYQLSIALIRKKLVETGLSPKAAGDLALLAGGSWGRAQALAGTEAGKIRQRVFQLVAALCRQDLPYRWQVAGEIEKEEDKLLFLEQLLFWYRDLLILKETGAKDLLLNWDQEALLKELNQYYSRQRLLEALETIAETSNLLGGSVNHRLALDVLVGKLEPDLID